MNAGETTDCFSHEALLYRGTDSFLEGTVAELIPVPGDATRLPFARSDLSTVRHVVRRAGAAAGLPEARVAQQSGTVICEVCDAGRITDPLAGRSRPRPEAGRGLWLVNRLCDLVELRALPTGDLVRFRLSAPVQVA